jgi:hypothetical protein
MNKNQSVHSIDHIFIYLEMHLSTYQVNIKHLKYPEYRTTKTFVKRLIINAI